MVLNSTIWHNITALENVSSVVSVTDYISTSTHGVFFQLLIIAIFLIMLMSMIRYGFQSAVITSGFLCFILSLYLVSLKYINVYFSVFFAVIVIFMTLYLYMSKQL